MRVSKYIKAHKDILLEYIYDDGNNISEKYDILLNIKLLLCILHQLFCRNRDTLFFMAVLLNLDFTASLLMVYP